MHHSFKLKLHLLSVYTLIFIILQFLFYLPKNVSISNFTSSTPFEQSRNRLFGQKSYFIENNLAMEIPKYLSKGNKLVNYTADWNSLDSRPLPRWYDESKIGIFVHWGVYSVIGLGEWIWHNWEGDPDFPEMTSYQEFASNFTAENWNPMDWVKLFKRSGAKYVVLTSKHHDGYTLWPSKYSFSWNSEDIGPQRDLVGELAYEVRRDKTMHFGLYHSLYEWYNRLWISDKHLNNLTTDEFVRFKSLPSLYEIVNTYKPEIIWSDGEWEASDTYWKSKEFLSWLYNESPVRDTVVVNDRWGGDTLCKHGGFLTCKDRFNPGKVQPRKFENAFSLDKTSWGISLGSRRSDYLTSRQLIHTIVQTVACGGNALVNVGPTKKGFIPRIQQNRLLSMGNWLSINGQAIYKTIPWFVQQDKLNPNIWYTSSQNKKNVFVIILSWPITGTLYLENLKTKTTIKAMKLFGSSKVVKFSENQLNKTFIQLPERKSTKSKWAWVIKVTFQ